MDRRAVAFAMIVGVASSGANSSNEAPSGFFEADSEGNRIDAQLAAENPGAEKLWQGAMEARGNDDFLGAAKLYDRVAELVPKLDAALRRACTMFLFAQRIDDALDRCRKAIALQASPANEYMLAQVLARSSPPPVPIERADEAVRLMNAAFAQSPTDPDLLHMGCRVMLLLERWPALADWSDRYRRAAPDLADAWLFVATSAIHDERWSDADAAIAAAKEKGAILDDLAKLQADEARAKAAQPWSRRWGPTMVRLSVAVASLALCFYLGVLVARRRRRGEEISRTAS